MNAQEYLIKHNLKPYNPRDEDGFPPDEWFWGIPPEDSSTKILEEDRDVLLPKEIVSFIKEKQTYPACFRYVTAKAAIDDFEQAFNKAVTNGWNPLNKQ